MSETMYKVICRHVLVGALCALLIMPAHARVADRDSLSAAPPAAAGDVPEAHTVQNGCVSLSEAVEQVRRRSDVERVISAETRVSQGREVHYIRVMTRDGKVRTERVNGCRRN